MSNFDSHFKNIQRRNESFFRFAMAVWVVIVLATVGVLGALAYVAIHFLAKVW